MKANCPKCGTVGKDETLARGVITVRHCLPCNLVFDGLRAPNLLRLERAKDTQRMEPTAFRRVVEACRQLLGIKRKDAA